MVEPGPHFIGVPLLGSTNLLTDIVHMDLTLIVLLLANISDSSGVGLITVLGKFALVL